MQLEVENCMLLIFDGDCAFCTSSTKLFQRITKGRIPTIPYQLANLAEHGLTAQQCERALQYVNSHGVFEGHLAVAQALKDSKTAWAIVGHLLTWPIISSAAFVVYDWVSKNRNRLPGGTPACATTDR